MVDYLIIGAGSAGCVLANRLTENPDSTVLLLEAGGPDDNPDIRIPARWFNLLGTDVDWCYLTEPQVHLNNRMLAWNRGKVLGGSSSINALVYIRGHHWDYDRWAELGNEAWSFAGVLPYFKKAENQERGPSEYHGVGGPLNVADIGFVYPISNIFINAGLELGLSVNDDFNGATQEGVGWYQVTQKNGERHSAVDAYLRPALKRPNLRVLTHAHVTRILFEGTLAVGVEYVHNDRVKQVYADQEVILSGGAINSPQILLCSGIGPANHLRQFDIPVVVDLPGVGENLQDHPKVDLLFTSNPPTRVDFSLSGAAYEDYLQTRSGLLSVVRSPVGGFVKTKPDLDLPDVQYYSAQAAREDRHDFTIVASLLRPKSSGQITLRSNNPFDYPIIQPNYLACDEDLQVFIDSVKFVRELVQTRAYMNFLDAQVSPGTEIRTDAEIATWIRNSLGTTWHYAGTCKMGIDPLAVVNPQLQVYDVKGLRVVDASIMPEVIGGNTNAAVIMIAEKAADMIRGGN
jgi:choline dehydrogenase